MSSSFMEAVAGDSMESAAQRVSVHIENMIDSADVFNKLTQNGSSPFSGLGDRFYTKGRLEFVLKRRIPLPDELTYQIRNMRSQFSMGLFTEITRAWVVIDSDIFMWNYETNEDLAYFDALESVVLKIALVRVKADVFAVSPLPFRFLFLFSTVALDNSSLNDISSTNDGRIFFTADDKLYEFVYEHNAGWFGGGRKCRIVNKSVTLLSTLIPFLGPGNGELHPLYTSGLV
uniref:Nucleoporin_N domain-containing protein n=1 Tax=Angiostrongylus cantonensis TaxID=6313 RepID=A0A0K0DJP7_ANGCA